MIVEERKNITTNGKYVRGSLLSYQLDTFGFKGRTDNQNISIEVYESGVFRIRISKNDEFDNFDYALEKDINPKSIDYLEKEDSIIISTGTVELTIMKTPFRVVFRNEKGHNETSFVHMEVNIWKSIVLLWCIFRTSKVFFNSFAALQFFGWCFVIFLPSTVLSRADHVA